MNRIDIKPLSVNQAWQGKRFKTDNYSKYERNVSLLLPRITIPEPPLRVYFEFGFSNTLSDIDNPVKPFMDILQKKYNFNDRDVFELSIKKTIVNKGKDYIIFNIESQELSNLF